MKVTQNNSHGNNYANINGEDVELFQTKGDKPKEEGDKLFFGKVNLDKINAGIIKGKEKVRRDTLSSVVEKLEGLKKPVHPDFEVNLENNGYNEALNNSIALIKEII